MESCPEHCSIYAVSLISTYKTSMAPSQFQQWKMFLDVAKNLHPAELPPVENHCVFRVGLSEEVISELRLEGKALASLMVAGRSF